MILAKCCHDLDLLQYYAGSACKTISSMGDLTYFNKENAPVGATARCVDCPHKDTCAYSATRFYLNKWAEEGKPVDCWPYTVLAPVPVKEAELITAVENGPYGRCVFACDNNVVDHQITQMTFENGVKATLTMMGFTSVMGRRMTFYGTLGEMTFDEKEHCITVERFGKNPERIDTKIIEDNGYGHGGGDLCLVESLYDMMEGNATAETSLERSIESHLMGIYAEKSRLEGGKLFYVHKEN
jgi:predicted dehydrogenase